MLQGPTILLTMDSIRADTFPDIFCECNKILQQDFNLYESAYSHGVATPFAFPGMIGGHPPKGDGTLLSDHRTIAETIAGESVAWTNNPLLNRERGYDRGFDQFRGFDLDVEKEDSVSLSLRFKQFAGRSTIIRRTYNRIRDFISEENEVNPITEQPYSVATDVTSWCKSHLSEDPPSFLWAHFQDGHNPFTPEVVTDREIELPCSRGELARLNNWFNHPSENTLDKIGEDGLFILNQMYNENIRYLDRTLADLLSWCRQRPWYDEATIVLTSDHGEAFGEQGLQNHQWNSLPRDVLINIPLAIKSESAPDRNLSQLVCHRDVYDLLSADKKFKSRNVPFISASNSAVRVTDLEGYRIRRRQGETFTNGKVSKKAESALQKADFPRIVDPIANEAVGANSDDLEERLQQLGYLE